MKEPKKHPQRRMAAVLCALALCAPMAHAEKVLDYDSPEVGCDWLEAEYASAQSRHEREMEGEEPPAVTREGVLMTFGMLAIAPFVALGQLFGGGEDQTRYDFSRDPDDIARAAEDKNCADLLLRMQEDREAGLYPPSPPPPAE